MLRTRAGLGRGSRSFCLAVDERVTERFAQSSPYVLHRKNGSYRLDRGDELITPLELSPRPAWYPKPQDHNRKAMTRIGTLQAWRLSREGLRVLDREAREVELQVLLGGLNLGVDDATTSPWAR